MTTPATDIEIPWEHQQSAHCESGTITGLLRQAGLDISEPMAFGISAGMTFAYLPFVKFGGQPLFAYRMPPGRVIRGVTRRLGIKMHVETFRDPAAGTAALDHCLAAGHPVGVQASAYWLTYFPPDMRFHFNAHNLVVYGKRGDEYLISDPVIDIRVQCKVADLEKARFTRGVMAPHGRLYYPVSVPAEPDMARAIRSSIRHTTGMMLHTPVPLLGVRGIRTVARRIAKLNPTAERRNKLLLGHIVRMQEEIGTGGGGFRFLYAAFLQEAAELLQRSALEAIATELTGVGDAWRAFALDAAKMCKGRESVNYAGLAAQLRVIADAEAVVYRKLRKAVK